MSLISEDMKVTERRRSLTETQFILPSLKVGGQCGRVARMHQKCCSQEKMGEW